MKQVVPTGDSNKEALLGTIPNTLCTLRVLLSPVAAWNIASGDFVTGTGIFILCGLTDLIDGEIARMNPETQSSVLGTYLDPFADKVMVVSAMLAMGYVGILSPMFTSLVMARDISFVAAGFAIRARTKDPDAAFFSTTDSSSLEVKPSLLSKANTMGLLMLISGACYSAALGIDISHIVTPAQFTLSATTILSWWLYYSDPGIQRILRGSESVSKSELGIVKGRRNPTHLTNG